MSDQSPQLPNAEQPQPEDSGALSPVPNKRVAYAIVLVLVGAFLYQLAVNKTVDKFLAGLLTFITLTFAGYKVDERLARWLGGGK